MKSKIFSLSILSFALALALTGASDANAASYADADINQITPLIIKNHQQNTQFDITNTWAQYITTDDPDGTNNCTPEQRQSFLNKTDWVVTTTMNYQSTSYDTASTIMIGWETGDHLNYGTFRNTAPDFYFHFGLHKTPDNLATMQLYNGKIIVDCYSSQASTNFFSLSETYVASDGPTPMETLNRIAPKLFLNTYSVQYPDGYAGNGAPIYEDTPVPPEKPDYDDLISFHYDVNQKKIMFWDSTNWGNADKNYIVCRWMFSGVEDGKLYDTLGPCTGEVRTVNIENYDTYVLTYDVLFDSNNDGIYNPEDDNEIVGSISSEIKMDGQTFTGGAGSTWEDNSRFEPSSCFQDFFPWVNLEGCASVIGGALELLSFNTFNLTNDYDTGNGCVALNTLGSWIQAPNATVCPQIPATIRNIITPFITLALALSLIGFIARQKADNLG